MSLDILIIEIKFMEEHMINLENIPSSPGCYIYKDVLGKVIYVGKAKNLKKRVSSYFLKKDHDTKTQALVSNISSVDFIVTSNELEALVLENNLIKKYMPKYNIDLKTGQRYAYIQLTKETFPRLLTLREKPSGKDYNVFGPFVSGQNRLETIRFLNKQFKLRTCKRLPKKPCVRYHIGYCSAPCINNITKEEYSKTIDTVKKILSGKSQEHLPEMKKEMEIYSKSQDFEKALTLRDQISAIEYLAEKQNMERKVNYDQDIINYEIRENTAYVLLFNIDKGLLINKKEFTFDSSLVDISVLDDFLIKYYSNNQKTLPQEIILPEEISLTTKEYLEGLAKKKIAITIPKIGEKKQLLDLCFKNIEITFFRNISKVQALKEKLKLKTEPHVIECFDISHLSGTLTVGSMVTFRGGVPDKSNYRRFRIKTLEKNKIDDFKAIAEVVRRRYLNQTMPLPDLIVIDGGKGQLSSAVEVLKDLRVQNKVQIISLAKRDEEIFRPDNLFPLKLNKKDIALLLLEEIRDEAHRFAINYNKLLRGKEIK